MPRTRWIGYGGGGTEGGRWGRETYRRNSSPKTRSNSREIEESVGWRQTYCTLMLMICNYYIIIVVIKLPVLA